MIDLKQRANNYNNTFKKFSKQAPLIVTERWLYGVWMLGNNYKSKMKYYGEYPPSYLKRIRSLFPDIKKEFHLFSGTVVRTKNITTFDINKNLNPDIVGDAEKLSEYVEKNTIMLIISDPPYSEEDACHYGVSLINRNKVVKECYKILKLNGFLVWLDQVLPMYNKLFLNLIGTIGIIRSTNHRVRFCFIFQKINDEEWK